MLVEIVKFGKEERTAVTSLDVAETFGKAHDKVMRDIRELGCSAEFNIANFGDISKAKSICHDTRRVHVAGHGIYRRIGDEV